jgi:outer membrane protein OmpA-like peptidoglycan-associated protein
VSFAALAGNASPCFAQVAGATPSASAAPPSPAPALGSTPSTSPPAPAPTVDTPPTSGEPTSSPDQGDEGEDGSQRAEWAERERLLMESNAINGGTGLLRTQHAETGVPGQLRISFIGEGFGGASFLCTKTYPCVDPNSGKPLTTDTMSHVGGTLSAGASIVRLGAGVLDAYSAVTAYANSDSANKPQLLQVLGDMDLGLKYAFPVGDILRFGVFTELWLVTGAGSLGLSGDSTSAKFGGIVTADLRGLEGTKVPLRFSLDGVYYVDNTAQVVSGIENTPVSQGGLGTEISRVERYGLGISRVDEFDLLPGLEGIFVEDRVRPFVESKIEIPTNRQGYKCNPTNPSHDSCLKSDPFALSTLTIGSRFFPWKRGFDVLAAIDIGLSGTNNFIEEMQPIAPWTLYVGAGWAVDTQDRPPVIKRQTVTKVVERAPPPRGHVVGFVHEKDKTEPIRNAICTYRDHPELSPLATGADGKFGDDLPAGTFTYDIKAEEYKPATCEATVPKTGSAAVTIDCPLEALPKVGTLVGHVRDADSNEPLSGVPVVLTDAQHNQLRLMTDASGGFRFDGVTPGTAQINVTTDGYLVFVAQSEIKVRRETNIDLALRPQPKNSAVRVTKSEITIKEQIQFALDSSVILPASFGLLTEIADTMIRHTELLHIEVQGHTDNSGTAEHNKILSEQRAEAVQAWLVQHGVPTDKLIARGYGQEKPLVPNVTAGNRARNRRVQFIIREREGAARAPVP